MQRRIAIANQKGGTGKTTTTVNLAGALAEQGRRVLVVDLDPQGHATKWLKRAPDPSEPGLVGALGAQRSDLTSLIEDTPTDNLWLIAATPWLNAVTTMLDEAGLEPGEEHLEFRLKTRLSRLEAFDYVLFDCRPSVDFLTLSALVAADEVIIPVETTAMAADGLIELTTTISQVIEGLNPSLTLCGILPCKVNSTRLSTQIAEGLRASFPHFVFATGIRVNVKLAEAYSFRQPITTYDPRSTGCEDYRSLASEVLGQEAAFTESVGNSDIPNFGNSENESASKGNEAPPSHGAAAGGE